MATRLACILAMIAFAMCLVVGGFDAGNTFSTTVARALAAMAGTFVIGLLVGGMAQKMITELGSAASAPAPPEKVEKPAGKGR